MAGAPDLFVVCKNCQSEVSPYITECPYCGQRLRKRAPKLDRDGRPSEPFIIAEPEPEPPKRAKGRKPSRRQRAAKPPKPPKPPKESRRSRRSAQTSPERAGRTRRPVATILLVLAGLVITLGFRAGLWPASPLVLDGPFEGEWWRLITTSFVYSGIGYQAAALATVAIFGWLLERRHGAWATLLVYVLGTLAGSALVMLFSDAGAFTLGGSAGALALLCAWAMRDLLGRRRGEEDEADMLGVAVWVTVLLLIPLATPEAHPLAGFGGAAVGVLLGLVLARLPER